MLTRKLGATIRPQLSTRTLAAASCRLQGLFEDIIKAVSDKVEQEKYAEQEMKAMNDGKGQTYPISSPVPVPSPRSPTFVEATPDPIIEVRHGSASCTWRQGLTVAMRVRY